MRSTTRTRTAILLGACAVAGCLAPRADLEQRPTFGLHVAIADDYEVQQTVPETLPGGIPLDTQGIDGEVDYTSIELSIGATTYQYVGPATGADGRPVPE
ncbi:MAG: hypothetical protein AAFZ65_01440, partial [Planctomycetota bacterium]